MNYLADIIVIGDSKEGHEAVKRLAASKPTIKITFISREFKSKTTHDYLNVEYLKEEVIFIDYKNRLFGCYLKNGNRVFGTHLIIATGEAYEPLLLDDGTLVPCVSNTVNDIAKTAKVQPAVVFGKQNSDVKLAIEVAKKYKYVYFCIEKLTLDDITLANNKKLKEAKNIAILPNTTLKNVILEEGILQAVELTNYSKINCSAIYIKTPTIPETAFVSTKLIQKDETQHLIVKNNAESLIIPKCFAIGNCIIKYKKQMGQLMIDCILKDF